MLASLPSAPEWMRLTISTKGGALRIWKPTSTLTLPWARLRYLESFAGLRNIDADRLLAVGVLAAGNDGFQMLNVEERRRGDLDRVDVFGGGELFEGAVAVEGETRVDGGHIQRGVELVEVLFAERELVGEDVRERDEARGGVLRKGGGDGGAAVAAAEQPEAHGGVSLVAEGGRGLDEEEAGGCGGGLDEVASVHDDCFLRCCGPGRSETAVPFNSPVGMTTSRNELYVTLASTFSRYSFS